MANIIAAGTADTTSAEFTLAAGDSTTLFLTLPTGEEALPGALVKVQIKSAGATWTTVGTLGVDGLGKVLTGAGTYRAWRPVSPIAVGVERI